MSPPLRVAALILAAGASRRMGGTNKLLAPLDGAPMVARVADAALASAADPVVVVTGHDGAAVRAALGGRSVAFVDNPAHEAGMSTSLKRGVAALPEACAGACVLLADMPRVAAPHIDALLAAFAEAGGEAICVPRHGGRRGNPVVWPRRFFAAFEALAGDFGARGLIDRHAAAVRWVDVADDAVLVDVDVPGDLEAVAGTPA